MVINPNFSDGGLAQLVERLHGMQEVRGSTPLTSTSQKKPQSSRFCGFFVFIIRYVKKFLKLLIGLIFLPLCWAASRTFFFLLQSLPAGDSGWIDWALPIGFLMSVLGFFLLPQAFRTYVLGHELTHALSGLLMGAKVGKIKVGKEGGHVMLSKSNFIISLAPYFFPFYTGLIIAIWHVFGFFFDVRPYEAWWLLAVGMTWGFHLTFTVYMLTQEQPDVLENGRLFSYVIIYLANLFVMALWMILIGDTTFKAAAESLSVETLAAYGAVWIKVFQTLENPS